MSEADPEPVTKSGKHYDESGDLEILTSDGVLCKVHRHYLQSASQVFRDMMKNSTTSRIELSDKEIEVEDVFGYLLNVIKGDPIDTTDIYDIPILTKVIRLAQKYVCGTALERISLQCRVDLAEKRRPLLPLMVGFALNDMGLCVSALSTPGGKWRPEEWDGVFGDRAENGHVMDPTALPLEISRLVKPETMWTWVRSYRLVYHIDSSAEGRTVLIKEESQESCEEFGCDFMDLADLQNGVPPYTLS